LQQLAQLVGMDALSPGDRLLLETARMVREDILHQNAFDDIDAYTSLSKQGRMLAAILTFHRLAEARLAEGAELSAILQLPVREAISRAKLIAEAEVDAAFSELVKQMEREIAGVS